MALPSSRPTAFCSSFLRAILSGPPERLAFPSPPQLNSTIKTFAALVELHGLKSTTPHNAMRFFHPVSEGGLGFTSATAVRAGALAASWSFCSQTFSLQTGFADLPRSGVSRPSSCSRHCGLTQRLHEELLDAQGVVNLPLQLMTFLDGKGLLPGWLLNSSISQWSNHHLSPRLTRPGVSPAAVRIGGAWLQFPLLPFATIVPMPFDSLHPHSDE
jgi:hypothetical protein